MNRSSKMRARELSQTGVKCTAVQCDLATAEGVAKLLEAIGATGRPVDALLANAGRGLGNAFLDQGLDEVLNVIHTNIDGTVRLIHHVANSMRDRGKVASSSPARLPGSCRVLFKQFTTARRRS